MACSSRLIAIDGKSLSKLFDADPKMRPNSFIMTCHTLVKLSKLIFSKMIAAPEQIFFLLDITMVSMDTSQQLLRGSYNGKRRTSFSPCSNPRVTKGVHSSSSRGRWRTWPR